MTYIQENAYFTKSESDVFAVGDTITLGGIETANPHCFAGVQFFADASGAMPVTPGAGTVAITVETINNEGIFEAITDPAITATSPTTVDWAANTTRVRATPSGVTVATHYKLVVTTNRS